ncbi:MAG: Lipoprotein signal peptidase [Burkholderia plantarii]|nr:MAG: Lipoprotein signal peptidase [Burkholderia plantarii]
MAKTLSKPANGALAPWLGISLIVILFDQLTKIAVLKTFSYGALHTLAPFFNLTLIYNRGAAFGFLSTAGGWQRWAFTALGIAATLVICYLLKRHGQQRLFSLSLALILGGALGNVLDRLMYGHVIDFLDFHVGAWHWPAFNLADSAITVGAVLLIYDELRRVRGSR